MEAVRAIPQVREISLVSPYETLTIRTKKSFPETLAQEPNARHILVNASDLMCRPIQGPVQKLGDDVRLLEPSFPKAEFADRVSERIQAYLHTTAT